MCVNLCCYLGDIAGVDKIVLSGLVFNNSAIILMKENVPFQFAFNAVMFLTFVVWGSIAGIATCYALDILGITPWWGRDFPHLSRSSMGCTQPCVQLVHKVKYSAEVKEIVELYLYSPSVLSWQIIG